MSEFKVGDRVRITEWCDPHEVPSKYDGLQGSVIRVYGVSDVAVIRVRLDGDPCPDFEVAFGDLLCWPNEIERVE